MTAAEISALVTAGVAFLTALAAYIRARLAHKAASSLTRRQPGITTPIARRSAGRMNNHDR